MIKYLAKFPDKVDAFARHGIPVAHQIPQKIGSRENGYLAKHKGAK
jgi:hypothetical protein